MTRNIDELNNLNRKAEDPEVYFKSMELSETEKKRRIEYTNKAKEIFDIILILILLSDERGSSFFTSLRDRLEASLLELISEYTQPDDYLIDYATDTAYNFVDTTEKHIDEEWYTSADRSLFNAENSANDVLNYDLYQKAIIEGKTHKKWITEKDNRVRKTHKPLDGKTIGIKELFYVGGVPMRFPKDYEYAEAFPQEVINCRCSIKYLPEEKELFRKETNEGEYSELEEPMRLKHVKSVVKDMGLDQVQVKYKIDRQPQLVGKGIFGSTSTNGKIISLFPDAFINREQLVKTIGHEHTHLKQIKESGNIELTKETIMQREKEAILSEEYWWNEYVRRTHYRQ